MTKRYRRNGYALLSTLWLIVLIATACALLAEHTRLGLRASFSRGSIVRLEWAADGCLAYITAELYRARRIPTPDYWLVIDSITAALTTPSALHCALSASPVGARPNINRLSTEQFGALLTLMEVDPELVRRAQRYLNEWRGSMGSRSEIQSVAHLSYITDMEHTDLERFVDVEGDRLSTNHAAAGVIVWFAGLPEAVVTHIDEARRTGRHLTSYADLAGGIGGDDADALLLGLGDLSRTLTVRPEAWRVTARTTGFAANLATVVELRLIQLSPGSHIVERRRSWVE